MAPSALTSAVAATAQPPNNKKPSNSPTGHSFVFGFDDDSRHPAGNSGPSPANGDDRVKLLEDQVKKMMAANSKLLDKVRLIIQAPIVK